MRRTVWAAAVVMVLGCGDYGGDGGDGPGPAPTPPPGGTTTFTITEGGVQPKTMTVTAGTRVTFTNDDSEPHQIASTPHNEHTDCPELNGPVLEPGESFDATMTTVRECGFHDHLTEDTDPTMRGTITVTASTDGPAPTPEPPSDPY